MNHKTIEKSIARAINQAPPPDFNDIANTPIIKMTEHDYITRQSEAKSKNYHRQLAVAFSCCAVILLMFTGWFLQFRMPDSIITLDVNPSIKIMTNRQEKVISVTALNADGQKVLDNLDNHSPDLNRAVASIVTSMIQEGYFNNDRKVILLSVENKNTDKSKLLAASLNKVIRDRAKSQNIAPLILKQTFSRDKDETALAEKYNISVGKLKLIQRIITSQKTYSIDALAAMSMEDLLAISNENGIDLHNLIQFDDSMENDNSSASDVNRNKSKPSKEENDLYNGDSQQSGKDQSDNNSSKFENDQGENESSQSKQDQGDNNSLPSKNKKGHSESSNSENNQGNNNSTKSENDQGDSDKNSSNSETDNKNENDSNTNSKDNVEDSDSNDEYSNENSNTSNTDNNDEGAVESDDSINNSDSSVSKTDNVETNSTTDSQMNGSKTAESDSEKIVD